MVENSENLNAQAIELASRGCFVEAIACFKKAITIDKKNYLLWYNLGVTYRDAGDMSLAKEALEQALLLQNNDTDTLETLSMVCFVMEDFESAYNYSAEALQINPNNPHLWNNLGVVLFNTQQYEDACEAFEKAVSLYPHYYDALYNLRDTYQQLHNEVGVVECEARIKNLNRLGDFYA